MPSLPCFGFGSGGVTPTGSEIGFRHRENEAIHWMLASDKLTLRLMNVPSLTPFDLNR